jgi:putative flippase GtrA
MKTYALRHQAMMLWRSQQIRFIVVGVWNTLAGYLMFVLFYSLLAQRWPYPVLAVLTHVSAVTQAFVCQRYLVYCSGSPWLNEYGRFHLAHLSLFLVSLSALAGLVEFWDWHPLLAQAFVTVGTALASYFIHTYFTFRQTAN